ncbi:hypothetical protein C3L33_22281, partial [Rhododendron williamsianum]
MQASQSRQWPTRLREEKILRQGWIILQFLNPTHPRPPPMISPPENQLSLPTDPTQRRRPRRLHPAFGSDRSAGLTTGTHVAASHLDTVLEKLKDILNNVGQSILQRSTNDHKSYEKPMFQDHKGVLWDEKRDVGVGDVNLKQTSTPLLILPNQRRFPWISYKLQNTLDIDRSYLWARYSAADITLKWSYALNVALSKK